MSANAPYDAALIGEPRWPEGDGPFLFLIEESGPLERRLLSAWIERHRPGGVADGDVERAILPQTRRRRRRRTFDPRLDAYLTGDSDPLLVPLRVIWLPSVEHDGDRRVGLKDMLTFGDPRDPGTLHQHVILRLHPDRVRVVMGQTARASEINARWQSPGEKGKARGFSLLEYTMHQAWLALERAERALRGNRYKVPKFPIEMLVSRRDFARGVARLARESGVAYEAMARRTRRYAREIAATHSPYVIDLVTGGIQWLIAKAYVDLDYSRTELQGLFDANARHPLVFLPSHKSNYDHLVLQYVLYESGLPPNHTAGGINMNFFLIGPILRRSGVFFIRREFKNNEPYKYVLRQYIDYLLEKRFTLEWYIEGGRSRSGKLREPRLGMLSYVVGSYRRGSSDDVVIVPVSIAYDQITDVGSYAAEQTGGAKDKESLSWMVRTIRNLHRGYGAVHVRFGEPLSLHDFMKEHPDAGDDSEDRRDPAVPKLAFEIAVRINEATPLTPISLVTLALLTAEDRGLTVEEVMDLVGPYVDFVKRRGLPVTEELALDRPEDVRAALDALTDHRVVARFHGATETVYSVGPDQHIAAAYYRNTIIHHFLNAAITELALIGARSADTDDVTAWVFAEAVRIRDVLKFEFFFSPRDAFTSEIEFELTDHDPDWRDRLAAHDVDPVLACFRPFRSPAVLRPFLEAYRVIGDIIERRADDATLSRADLASEALTLAKQYHLQRRIRTGESVSSVLMASATELAANRGLFEDGSEVAAARRAFAADLRDVVQRLGALDAFAAASDAGLR